MAEALDSFTSSSRHFSTVVPCLDYLFDRAFSPQPTILFSTNILRGMIKDYPYPFSSHHNKPNSKRMNTGFLVWTMDFLQGPKWTWTISWNEGKGRQTVDLGHAFFFMIGALVASIVVFWNLTKRVWPKKAQILECHAESRGRREAILDLSETVLPVAEQVSTQIRAVEELVEEAVLELIVRFQEITDLAIAEANETASKF